MPLLKISSYAPFDVIRCRSERRPPISSKFVTAILIISTDVQFRILPNSNIGLYAFSNAAIIWNMGTFPTFKKLPLKSFFVYLCLLLFVYLNVYLVASFRRKYVTDQTDELAYSEFTHHETGDVTIHSYISIKFCMDTCLRAIKMRASLEGR